MSGVDFLDKLLDGFEVEWKALGEVCRFINGRAYKQPELLGKGKYPVLRVGNFFTNDNWYYSDLELDKDKYCDSGDLLYAWSASFGPRIWDGGKVIYHYHIWKVVPDTDLILKKFLFYLLEWDTNALKSEHATGSTMMHVTKGAIESRLVPIPCPDNPKKSFEIQAEIVRILDAFTELTAELTAELAARKKQYNYYRGRLLSFEEGDVEWKTLGSILTMRAGQHISASRISDVASDGFIYPCFGGNGVRGYVKEKSHSGEYLLVGRQGALCGNVQRMKGDFYATEHAVVVTVGEGVNVDFAFHMLTLMNLNQYASQSAQPGLAVGKLEGLKMAVPSLAEQVRIAAILDKFDALTNSLTEGLPREIELRQKQYEYYRDLLLSFPKPEEAEA